MDKIRERYGFKCIFSSSLYSVLLSEVRQMVIYLGEYHITFRVFKKKKGELMIDGTNFFFPLNLRI